MNFGRNVESTRVMAGAARRRGDWSAALWFFRAETGQGISETLLARREDLAGYVARARRWLPGRASRDS